MALPAIYKRFMFECGCCAGLFMRDADFFYPAVVDLKERLADMMREDGLDFALPEPIFVLSAYQGYQYQYQYQHSVCDGTDDPAVYRVMDGAGPRKIADALSSHRREAITQYGEALCSACKGAAPEPPTVAPHCARMTP